MRSAAGVEVILMRAVIMGWHRLAYLRELIKVVMRKEKQASLAWYSIGKVCKLLLILNTALYHIMKHLSAVPSILKRCASGYAWQ